MLEEIESMLRKHGATYPYFGTYPDQVRERVLVAGLIANGVRHLMKDERSIAAVDAAIAFGLGKIELDELRQAALNAHEAAYDYKTAYIPSIADASNAAAHAAYSAIAPDAAAFAYASAIKALKKT